MTAQTQQAEALQSAREILRDVCDAAEIPDAIRSRARSALLQLQPPSVGKRAAAPSGLTWWLQLESTDAASKELAAAIEDHSMPAVWTAVVQMRAAGGKCSTEALVCFARDARSMRLAFAERVGSHAANAATVFPGIAVNDVTMRVLPDEAVRMAEELIRRGQPFSLEARLEHGGC